MAINDFGQKIGGAKKDLWKARGLSLEDLLDMNEAEKVTYIKKDNVWQKPNYQELVDSGIPVRVVYFMKLMRDATPVKPVLSYSDKTPELIEAKQEGYISFVRDLRDEVMSLKTEADVLGFYENYLAKRYIIREPGRYYVTVSDEAFGCLDNKLMRAAQQRNFGSIDRDIKKKQFCYSEEAKLKDQEDAFNRQFTVVAFDTDKVTFDQDYSGRDRMKVAHSYGAVWFYPKGDDADPTTYEEGKWLIIRDGNVVAKNLESREAAQEYIKGLFQKGLEKAAEAPSKAGPVRKKRFVPKQLKHIQRNGPDFRCGLHATGEKYMSVFGFKGGEFGNWMSENDRRVSLDYGYDALIDMCKAINISVKDVALGGRLSIAFGARGSAGAAAHYEPLREVINLTKMHGAGSLAHEWAHAMDDILGKELGLKGFMTEQRGRPGVPQTLKDLVVAMQYKTVSSDEVLAKQKATAEQYRDRLLVAVKHLFPTGSLTEEQKAKLNVLAEAYVNNAKDCKEQFIESVFSGTGNGNKDVDALSAFRQEITGRGMPKQQRIDFAHYQNNLRGYLERIGTSERVKTDFYEDSIRFDKLHSKTDHGYWQSTIEMFARAFACYVHDKIEGQSDYLVGHSENAVTWASNPKTGELEQVKAIPDGEERIVLNRCFDALVCELKEIGLLHDFEPELAQVPQKRPSLSDLIQDGQRKSVASFKEAKGGQLEFEF